MSVSPGQTYLLANGKKPHLYVVLTEPSVEDYPRVAIVGLTTKRDQSDTTVVLSSSDHPFLRHWAVAFYAEMLIVRTDKLRHEALRRYADATPEVLSRLQAGALASPHTKPRVKSFCERLLSGVTF